MGPSSLINLCHCEGKFKCFRDTRERLDFLSLPSKWIMTSNESGTTRAWWLILYQTVKNPFTLLSFMRTQHDVTSSSDFHECLTWIKMSVRKLTKENEKKSFSQLLPLLKDFLMDSVRKWWASSYFLTSRGLLFRENLLKSQTFGRNTLYKVIALRKGAQLTRIEESSPEQINPAWVFVPWRISEE